MNELLILSIFFIHLRDLVIDVRKPGADGEPSKC